jgi:IclR family transcriptional regulator, acetate operon repressor
MSRSSGSPWRPDAGPAERVAHARHSVSVDRGFAILERFSGQRGSESIAAIAEAVKLPRSSVHRYLQTLAALGLVEQRGTPRRRYRLTPIAAGPGIAAIGATGMRALAHDELLTLRRSTECTARIAIRIELDALLVDQVPSFAEGQSLLALDTRPGTRLPGRGALGQALIAHLDVEGLKPSLRMHGREVHAELADVRERGYAVEDDGWACSLAVPIRLEARNSIAAIDLRGCAPQVTLATLEAHIGTLQATARRLATAIEPLQWVQWRPYARPAKH